MYIYHIVLPDVWETFEGCELYEAESLQTEGFIHCSYQDQIEGVLGRYYSSAAEVLILKIDPSLLTSKLVSEPSTNEEIYPHIYGQINRGAVIGIERRRVN